VVLSIVVLLWLMYLVWVSSVNVLSVFFECMLLLMCLCISCSSCMLNLMLRSLFWSSFSWWLVLVVGMCFLIWWCMVWMFLMKFGWFVVDYMRVDVSLMNWWLRLVFFVIG